MKAKLSKNQWPTKCKCHGKWQGENLFLAEKTAKI